MAVFAVFPMSDVGRADPGAAARRGTPGGSDAAPAGPAGLAM